MSLSGMIWWEVGAIIGVTSVGISKEIKTVYARERALSLMEFLAQFVAILISVHFNFFTQLFKTLLSS